MNKFEIYGCAHKHIHACLFKAKFLVKEESENLTCKGLSYPSSSLYIFAHSEKNQHGPFSVFKYAQFRKVTARELLNQNKPE